MRLHDFRAPELPREGSAPTQPSWSLAELTGTKHYSQRRAYKGDRVADLIADVKEPMLLVDPGPLTITGSCQGSYTARAALPSQPTAPSRPHTEQHSSRSAKAPGGARGIGPPRAPSLQMDAHSHFLLFRTTDTPRTAATPSNAGVRVHPLELERHKASQLAQLSEARLASEELSRQLTRVCQRLPEVDPDRVLACETVAAVRAHKFVLEYESQAETIRRQAAEIDALRRSSRFPIVGGFDATRTADSSRLGSTGTLGTAVPPGVTAVMEDLARTR